MADEDQHQKGKSFLRKIVARYEEQTTLVIVIRILVFILTVAGWVVAVVSCNNANKQTKIARKQTELTEQANENARKQTELTEQANENARKQTELTVQANENARKQTELTVQANANSREQTNIATRQLELAQKAEQARAAAETRLSQREMENKQLRDQIDKSQKDRATLNVCLEHYTYLLGRVQKKFAIYRDVPPNRRVDSLNDLRVAVDDLDKFVSAWKQVLLKWNTIVDGDEGRLTTEVANNGANNGEVDVEAIAATLKSLQDKRKELGEVMPKLVAAIPEGP